MLFRSSTHQAPWYPGTGAANETGEGKGSRCIINRPFAAGSGKGEIVKAFQEDLRRAADSFKPDLVLISAGFDSRRNDPLGQFTLTDEDFEDLTHIMLTIAGEHCQSRLVSVLEGGYSLTGLASAARAHLHTLTGPGSH